MFCKLSVESAGLLVRHSLRLPFPDVHALGGERIALTADSGWGRGEGIGEGFEEGGRGRVDEAEGRDFGGGSG